MLSALPALVLACAQAQPSLLTRVSSFDFGEQLSMDVTPDAVTPGDKIAFVAHGATIGIYRLTSSMTPTLLDLFHVPDCQPLALRYYRQPGTPNRDWLFIAGGSHGVWRVALCSSLISSYTSCGSSSYVPEIVASIDSGSPDFERKRCLDVEVLPASSVSGGNPVLLALFGASNDPAQSTHGGTELYGYSLSGTSLVGPVVLSFPAMQVGEKPAVGTSMAIDPGDPARVFLAMAKGGIDRVNLISGSPFGLQRTHLAIDLCNPCVDNVRDVAVFRNSSNAAFLMRR